MSSSSSQDRPGGDVPRKSLGPGDGTPAPTIDWKATEDAAGGTASSRQQPYIRYFGDYELIEELARGGMGVVFRARQVSLHRPVALKMILAGRLAGSQEIERFHREAEAAANLDHPHIVPIYEIGEYEGQHYFSMKLIEGGNLQRELPRLRNDLRAAVQILSIAARTVHHAHQRGVLHRDLKPANVLIDTEGRPHVTDFGLAKQVAQEGDLTVSGMVLGTPAYMAPEQARGERLLTTAVDVYSLGAMLYELLAGRAPFQGVTPAETLLAVVSHDPARPSSLARGVDTDLETIALKCLEKEPERRYDSAAALADDLDRWMRSEPILARRATAWEVLRKWVRRRPAQAALLGLTLVAVAALVGIWGWSYDRVVRAQAVTSTALEAKTEALHRESAALRNVARERDRVVAANITGQAILARTLLNRAAAERQSNRAGARQAALELIQDANQFRREVLARGTESPTADLRALPEPWELRSEAIEALASPDVELAHSFHCDFANTTRLLPGGKRVILSNGSRKTVADFMGQRILAEWNTDGIDVVVHPDGKMVACGRSGGGIELRRLPGAQLLRSAAIPGFHPLDLVFNREGSTVFAAGVTNVQQDQAATEVPKQIYAVETETGKQTLIVDKSGIVGIGHEGSGPHFLAVGIGHIAWQEAEKKRKRLVVYELATKRQRPVDLPKGFSRVRDFEFDAVTEHLVVLAGSEQNEDEFERFDLPGSLLLYEPEQETAPRVSPLTVSRACRIYCNPRTRHMAVAGTSALVLFDLPSESDGVCLTESPVFHRLDAQHVDWSPDGEYLLYRDSTPGASAMVWRVRTNLCVAHHRHTLLEGSWPKFVSWSDDGRWAMVPTATDCALVDGVSERVVRRFPKAYMTFSPDGLSLAGWQRGDATKPGWITLWELSSGREIARLEDSESLAKTTFNAKNELIVLRGKTNREVWNVNTMQLLWKVPEDLPSNLSFARGGDWLISLISSGFKTQAWEVGTGRVVAECSQEYTIPVPEGLERHMTTTSDADANWAASLVWYRVRGGWQRPLGSPHNSSLLVWRLQRQAPLQVLDELPGGGARLFMRSASGWCIVEVADRRYAWRLADGQKYFEINAATATDLNWPAVTRSLKEMGLD